MRRKINRKRKFTNSSQKSSLHYPKKQMTREKNAQISTKQATNTTLQTVCQENKNAQNRAEKEHCTTLQTLCQEK